MSYTTPFQIDVDEGTYEVSAVYDEFSDVKTVAVKAGDVKSVEFKWYIEKKPPVVTPCILVTVTCDTPTLEVYRNFRDYCLPVVLARAYYKVGKHLVPLANRLKSPLKLIFTKIARGWKR